MRGRRRGSHRGSSDDNDSLDLLLDTVSNVFGGVMFLTLLAALMILARGASRDTSSVPPATVPTPSVSIGPPIDDRIVQLELKQVTEAIDTQQAVLANLPGDAVDLPKLREIRNTRRLLTEATARLQQSQLKLEDANQRVATETKRRRDNERQRNEIAERLASKRAELEQDQQIGQRSIAFRPLTLASSTETILVLRYGRVYLFQNQPNGRSFNSDDFFAIRTSGGNRHITPKPHRGTAVTPEAMADFANRIRQNYPTNRYHVTIAVWDDSFGQFNMVCDALQDIGYRYRTIPCNNESQLSFGASASPWVQ